MIEKLLGIIEDQSNIINRLTNIVEKLTGTSNTQQLENQTEPIRPIKQKTSFGSVRGKLEQLHSNEYTREHHPEQTEEYWRQRADEESKKLRSEDVSVHDAGISRNDERDTTDPERESESFQEKEEAI